MKAIVWIVYFYPGFELDMRRVRGRIAAPSSASLDATEIFTNFEMQRVTAGADRHKCLRGE
jgi:hypothetical protein